MKEYIEGIGVNRVNIEQDTAIYKLETEFIRDVWLAGHIVRTSLYSLVNFGVFEWLYLVQCTPDKHQT